MGTGNPSSTAYCETIRHFSVAERKYIRYFDGRGHFGHVRLQLAPRPGAPCSVSVDAACALPEEAAIAAQHAISARFDRGSPLHLPLIGFEVRLMSGTYLPRHSYPEACAIAACMAFEEAVQRAAPMVVELYTGISLLIEFDALSWTTRALGAVLGELRSTQRVTDVVRLELEVPVRLLKEIQAMGLRVVRVFPLPRDMQYQPVSERGAARGAFPDFLEEWT
jgi:elongation factor G